MGRCKVGGDVGGEGRVRGEEVVVVEGHTRSRIVTIGLR